MDCPTHGEARLTAAIVATAVALIATFATLTPPAARAEAPADDEYVLQLPGARQSVNGSPASAAEDVASGGLQRGVAGETDPPERGFALLGSTIDDAPGSAAAGLAVLIGLGLLTVAARRRTADDR